MEYKTFFCLVVLANGSGRTVEVVACDESAAKADCMESFGDAIEVHAAYLKAA